MGFGMGEPAIVYYKPGCPFGLRLRAALTLRNVPYVAVRLRDDEAGAAAVRAVNDGYEISPTVRVGSTWLSNPRWRQVVAATSSATSASTSLPLN
jgi:mycoredoxin